LEVFSHKTPRPASGISLFFHTVTKRIERAEGGGKLGQMLKKTKLGKKDLKMPLNWESEAQQTTQEEGERGSTPAFRRASKGVRERKSQKKEKKAGALSSSVNERRCHKVEGGEYGPV